MSVAVHRNIALIGAGYWGKNLARNLNALGALHTLCDPNRATLDAYGADFAGARKVERVEDVWSDPEVTAVAIAAPAALHYRLAEAALAAGKDVFVEKPLCLDAAEAERLIARANSSHRILMVGHLLRYHPLIQHLLSLVAEGGLGAMRYIVSNRLNLGKFRREENALWSFAPHDLSVILALAGDRLPEGVVCTGGSYLSPGIADTTLTALRFGDGLRAHVHVSWLHPFKEQKLTVVGSEAMAVFDDTRPWAEKLAVYRGPVTNGPQGPEPKRVLPEYAQMPEAEPLRSECEHFLSCCRDRRAPRTDGVEGLRVLRVLRAAQLSLERDGQPVRAIL